jgi:hypothetical protein
MSAIIFSLYMAIRNWQGSIFRKREVGLPPKSEIPSDGITRLASEKASGRDLRNSMRRALHFPVTLTFGSKKYRGETVDISANGVLLRTKCPLTSGSSVRYTILLPGEAFGIKASVKVTCKGRVVRCSPASNHEGQDVAIVIDDYHFVPSRKGSLLKTA